MYISVVNADVSLYPAASYTLKEGQDNATILVRLKVVGHYQQRASYSVSL
jgi:hypothetical protein